MHNVDTQRLQQMLCLRELASEELDDCLTAVFQPPLLLIGRLDFEQVATVLYVEAGLPAE